MFRLSFQVLPVLLYYSSLDMCVCMSVLYVRACAFVPVIFLLDSCMFYVRARPIARLYIYSDSAN